MKIISGGDDDTVSEGTRLGETYFEFSVHPVYRVWDLSQEVPDELLLEHMSRAGCFDWLLDPAENIYTLQDGEPL